MIDQDYSMENSRRIKIEINISTLDKKHQKIILEGIECSIGIFGGQHCDCDFVKKSIKDVYEKISPGLEELFSVSSDCYVKLHKEGKG